MYTTIRLTVVTVFILATMLTAAVAIGLQYYFSQTMAREAAADLYTAAAAGITAEVRGIGRVNANVIDLLADNPDLAVRDQQSSHLEIFTRVLEKNPLFYGVYLGRGDGSFFEVINLDASGDARRAMRALPSDRWLVVTVEAHPGGQTRSFQYLDKGMQRRLLRSEDTDFNVTQRPWYVSARDSLEIQASKPYMFDALGLPGRTISKSLPGTDTVVAIDMTLASMSDYLGSHDVAEHGDIYLYSEAGEIVASSLTHQDARPSMPIPELHLSSEERNFLQSLPVLRVSNEHDWPPFDYTQTGEPRGYSIDVTRMIVAMTGLKIEFVNGYSWPELVAKFKAGEIDILHSLILTEDNKDWGLPGTAYASLPYALATREGHAAVSGPGDLIGATLAIPAGWSVIPIVRDRFPGVTILETVNTLEAINKVRMGEADAALDNEVIMRYVARHYFLEGLQYHAPVDLGSEAVPDKLHIMVQADQTRLRAILDKAIAAIGNQQRDYLNDTWLDFESDTRTASASTVPTNLLVDIAEKPDLRGQLLETTIGGAPYLVYGESTGARDGTTLFIGILAPLREVVAPFLDQVRISILVTGAFLLLLLPLSWIFATPIVQPVKQLAEENDKVRRREYDQVGRVRSNVKELDQLSESMVSMVESIRAHELAQRKLMDSFIQLIAQAIDDKSPYTAEHCERVPELALMLAEHASDSNLPAFRDFRLETEDQWREYRIAAWLHDCGKITTPEHIVDKGSKLETIYNRIHEVRMRFEALWRDAEIEYWRSLYEHPEQKEELKRELARQQEQLQEDYTFVAECNVGGEFLDQDKQDRLRKIADTRWLRHFDDRIGLSPAEELRLPPEPSPPLPTPEALFSDKPEHIVERTRPTDYPPELGINMEVPVHLYNQGELYNLSISRGTLTAEDRFKINEHMISTIKMLESLPFPPELQNVPRWASTHHETMRGSGYPRKLPGEQLSVAERIMAVADVFEALTAADRPYKKAKPVSVAIDILHKMVLDEHIDRDCFELFVRDKVYMEYAEKFLAPDQIDKVDVGKYFG